MTGMDPETWNKGVPGTGISVIYVPRLIRNSSSTILIDLWVQVTSTRYMGSNNRGCAVRNPA